MKKIVVIGDVMLDQWLIGEATRISPEAPVPVLKQIQMPWHFLGGAANVAAGLATLGCRTHLLGAAGVDPEVEVLKGLLNPYVESGHLSFDLPLSNEHHTILKTRVVAGTQQVARFDRDANYSDAGPVLLERLQKLHHHFDALVISDYSKGTISEVLLRGIVELRKDHEFEIFVNAKHNLGRWHSEHGRMTPDYLTVNAQEALCYLNDQPVPLLVLQQGLQPDQLDLGVLARSLGEALRIKGCVVTGGSQGLAFAKSNTPLSWDIFKENGVPANAVDVCGAGDTVLSTFVGSMLKDGYSSFDDRCQTAARYANLAGSMQVGRVGTWQPNWSELFLKNLGQNKFTLAKPELLATVVRGLQREPSNKKVVFTNGVFDVFHPGHLDLLRLSKNEGDFLIVGVNSDESASRLKGESRPRLPLEHRAHVLALQPEVDLVVSFDEDTPEELIKWLSPDVLVKGEQYKGTMIPGEDHVRSCGGRVALIPMVEGWSTTKILETAASGCSD
jgi:D-beta-D-heptose 7-phosphate kinase / D-beta-D-heptose 1-phosphate adenosyltransferase